MARITLAQAATRAGRDLALLKKHAQRGKLRVIHEGSRVMVEESDLEAYIAQQALLEVVGKLDGAPGAQIGHDVGNTIANLPQSVRDAILDGIPTTKKAGSPKPFLDEAERLGVKLTDSFIFDPDDPHQGCPIGYQHASSPRWKRINESTWELDGARYSWNGFSWEASGSRSGPLAEGVSPASPYAEQRPLSPPRPVTAK